DLDAGHQDLGFGRLLGVRRRLLVDGAPLLELDRARLVDRLADDVDDAAERALADRDGDRPAAVLDLLAAHQAFGRIHGDGAHGGFAEILRHFQHQGVTVIVGLHRVEALPQSGPVMYDYHPARHFPNLTM